MTITDRILHLENRIRELTDLLTDIDATKIQVLALQEANDDLRRKIEQLELENKTLQSLYKSSQKYLREEEQASRYYAKKMMEAQEENKRLIR